MSRHLRAVPRDPPVIDGVPPPHDLDAEGAVLSAVLLKPETIALVLEILRPADFYSEANGLIYAAAVALSEEGKAIDTVTVAARLKSIATIDGGTRLQAVGGVPYLMQIVDASPAIANVREHALIVAELAQRRLVIGEMQRRSAELYRATPDEAREHIDALQATIASAARDVSAPTTGMMAQAIDAAVEGVIRQQTDAAKRRIAGMGTGIAGLDALTGGLLGSDLTFLGGPPKGGKTSCAGGIIEAVSQQGEEELGPDGVRTWVPFGCAVFTMEMPREQYALKMACSWGRVDLNAIRTGTATADDFRRLYAAQEELRHRPVYFDDATDLSPAKLRPRMKLARAELAKRGAKLRLVVIDYIQLMEPSVVRERASEQEKLDLIGREVRKVSQGEPDVHFLVLSQLNDEGELRGTRGLDMHGTAVWKIFSDKSARDSERWGHDEGVKPARIHLARQRIGPWPRDVPLWFHERYGRFSDDSLL